MVLPGAGPNPVTIPGVRNFITKGSRNPAAFSIYYLLALITSPAAIHNNALACYIGGSVKLYRHSAIGRPTGPVDETNPFMAVHAGFVYLLHKLAACHFGLGGAGANGITPDILAAVHIGGIFRETNKPMLESGIDGAGPGTEKAIWMQY